MSKYSVISTRLMPMKPTVMDREGARMKLLRRLFMARSELSNFCSGSRVNLPSWKNTVATVLMLGSTRQARTNHTKNRKIAPANSFWGVIEIFFVFMAATSILHDVCGVEAEGHRLTPVCRSACTAAICSATPL